MKRIVVEIEYETALDDIEFGYWFGEDSPDEGDIKEVKPMTEFERACVDTFINLKLAMVEELVEMAKRIEKLEDRS